MVLTIALIDGARAITSEINDSVNMLPPIEMKQGKSCFHSGL
jgi:hypothetical protein